MTVHEQQLRIKKIVVVIPGLNEERYIGRVIRKAKKQKVQILYVDDGSMDKSPLLANREGAVVVRHEVNLGKGAAMKTGAEYAFRKLRADAIIFMDADDQHDSREIPKFITNLQHVDVVFGVRSQGTSMPLMRYLGNKMASIFLNILFGGYVEDIPSGYKAFSKYAYNRIKWLSSGYEVETEIAVRVLQKKIPFRTLAIEAIYHDTDKGMTALDALHIVTCMARWRIGM